MAHNGTKITAPISLHGDVYPVLAIAPSGAYYDVGEACKSEKVNMWSKHKPMNHDSIAELQEEWKKNIKYGITYPQSRSMADIVSAYSSDDVLNGWGYNRPTGGNFSPYRLTDFLGYFHSAQNLIISESINTDKLGNASGYQANANGFFSVKGDEGQLTIDDLFGGCYLGLCLYSASHTYYMANTEIQSGMTGYSLSISTQDVAAGTYKIFPIICLEQFSWSGSAISNYPSQPSGQQYIPLPYVEMKEIEIAEGRLKDYVVSVLRAQWQPIFTPLEGDVSVAAMNENGNVSVTLAITDIQEGVTIRNNRLNLIKGSLVTDYILIDNISGVTNYYRMFQFENVPNQAGYKVELRLNTNDTYETMVLVGM